METEFEKLLRENEDLRKAKNLLERVYEYVGPYGDGMPDELWNEVNKYLKFDEKRKLNS